MESKCVYIVTLFLLAKLYSCKGKKGAGGYNYGGHKKRSNKHVKTIRKPQANHEKITRKTQEEHEKNTRNIKNHTCMIA